MVVAVGLRLVLVLVLVPAESNETVSGSLAVDCSFSLMRAQACLCSERSETLKPQINSPTLRQDLCNFEDVMNIHHR